MLFCTTCLLHDALALIILLPRLEEAPLVLRHPGMELLTPRQRRPVVSQPRRDRPLAPSCQANTDVCSLERRLILPPVAQTHCRCGFFRQSLRIHLLTRVDLHYFVIQSQKAKANWQLASRPVITNQSPPPVLHLRLIPLVAPPVVAVLAQIYRAQLVVSPAISAAISQHLNPSSRHRPSNLNLRLCFPAELLAALGHKGQLILILVHVHTLLLVRVVLLRVSGLSFAPVLSSVSALR